jgi:hypothetical protein
MTYAFYYVCCGVGFCYANGNGYLNLNLVDSYQVTAVPADRKHAVLCAQIKASLENHNAARGDTAATIQFLSNLASLDRRIDLNAQSPRVSSSFMIAVLATVFLTLRPIQTSLSRFDEYIARNVRGLCTLLNFCHAGIQCLQLLLNLIAPALDSEPNHFASETAFVLWI